MKILVINSGSSSLKYQLLNMETKQVLAKGNCECIGTGGMITHKKTGAAPYQREMDFPTREAALTEVLHLLVDREHGVIADVSEIDAVGHRVVHGGKYQRTPPPAACRASGECSRACRSPQRGRGAD